MSDATSEIIYGLTGQLVETYPPEMDEGVPSAATCSVFAGDASLDDTAEYSPAVTIDSVSTTVDAASGASQSNRRKVSLTSTSNIVIGRPYRLANVDSQWEIVTPVRIVSGDYIEVETELRHDYAITSSTFKGLRMTFTVDATWVALEENILPPTSVSYKAVWAYTVNSVERRHYTYLRLVRQKAKHSVTVRDIYRRWPELADEEPRNKRGQQYRWAIEDAWADWRFDIRAEGYEPSQIRDTELVDRALIAKTGARIFAALNERDHKLLVDELNAEYARLFGKAISSLTVPLDEGTEGAASADPIQRYFFER